MSDGTYRVVWLSWCGAAFARAAAEGKPVLLSIGTSWCPSCRAMEASYADPAVAELINERFVPVRVDADRRPDLAERYQLGRWPTTAFLTSTGELLGGGTYVPAERLGPVLARLAEVYRDRRGELDAEAGLVAAQRMPAAAAKAAVSAAPGLVTAALCARMLAEFDAEHGGFGVMPKFPHADALTLALAAGRDSRDSRLLDMAGATLDAMGWGGLFDDVEGGFFRCAASPDWQQPRSEKLLGVNAALLRLYINAWRVLEAPRYQARALDVLRYAHAVLADPVDGGFAASQQADAAYYELDSLEARRRRGAPPVDQTMYTDLNAEMVRAYLAAADALEDDSLRQFAVRSLERVVLASYQPGRGLAHWSEACGIRGLLSDQVHASAALLDAHGATGNIVYEELAEELMHYCIRTMWDEEAGGFFDRIPSDDPEAEIGLLRERIKPFVINCLAARVLWQLAATAGDSTFRAHAVETLAAIGVEHERHGLDGAAYALALREVGTVRTP